MINLFSESPLLSSMIIVLIGYTLKKNLFNCAKFLIIVIGFLMYFYRAPYLNIAHMDNIVSGPSYGTIKSIIKTENNIHIVIYLGLTDVHVQYYPINGTVKKHTYDLNGKFELAFDLNKSKHNEKMITEIDTDYGQVSVTQIAGFLVRRISCPDKTNKKVWAGEKLGMIKFGSRVDLKLPLNGFILSCKVGDKVLGGKTILGYYKTN